MKSLRLDLTKILILLGIMLLLLIELIGCGDSGIVAPPGNEDNVSVSIMNDEGAMDDPSGTIVITEAKALIREVEFELEGSSIEHEIHNAVFVVNFNLTGAVQQITAGNIPSGVYNKVKFQIHKPEDNEVPPDPEFKEGTSGSRRYSFIIKGTYDGNNFIYKSRKSFDVVVLFGSPVNLHNSGVNLTIVINSASWFKAGNTVLDPRNPSNADLIDKNIENSFKRAFKDNDRNGLPDDN